MEDGLLPIITLVKWYLKSINMLLLSESKIIRSEN